MVTIAATTCSVQARVSPLGRGTLDSMGGGGRISDYVHDRGGIASYGAIISAGWTEDDVRFASGRRSIVALRRGWYGSPDLPSAVRSAWAAGGPLACISALIHLGEADERHPAHDLVVLHVALTRHAKPPRTVGRDAQGFSVVWHYAELDDRRRHAVDLMVARQQLAHCRSLRSQDPARG